MPCFPDDDATDWLQHSGTEQQIARCPCSCLLLEAPGCAHRTTSPLDSGHCCSLKPGGNFSLTSGSRTCPGKHTRLEHCLTTASCSLSHSMRPWETEPIPAPSCQACKPVFHIPMSSHQRRQLRPYRASPGPPGIQVQPIQCPYRSHSHHPGCPVEGSPVCSGEPPCLGWVDSSSPSASEQSPGSSVPCHCAHCFSQDTASDPDRCIELLSLQESFLFLPHEAAQSLVTFPLTGALCSVFLNTSLHIMPASGQRREWAPQPLNQAFVQSTASGAS